MRKEKFYGVTCRRHLEREMRREEEEKIYNTIRRRLIITVVNNERRDYCEFENEIFCDFFYS